MIRSAVLAITISVFGQLVAQQHSFVQLSTEEGLTQSQVRCLSQDAQGYLWVGTIGGVSRFDGHEFINFGLQDGLPVPQVNAMVSDESGNTWLALAGGLVKSNGRAIETVELPDGMNNSRIRSLALAPNGDLLLAADDHGVMLLTDSGVVPLGGFPADQEGTVRMLLIEPDGVVLVGSSSGLLRCADGNCKKIQLGDSLVKSVGAIARSSDGTLWVGTFGDGIFRISTDGTQQNFSEDQGLLQNNIRHLLVDDQQRVWVSTKFGLNLIAEDQLAAYTIYKGLPNDNIWCSFQDSEGNLWFGTDGAGVLKYAGDRFVTHTTLDGLCSQLVMCVVPDAQGDLWVGTYGSGICRLDGMAMVTTNDGLPNNTVWCGSKDADGQLWFGTSDGLAVMKNGVVQTMDIAEELLGVRVLSLYRSGDGRMFCGTREGLVILRPDGSLLESHLGENGPGRSVRSIVETTDGALWLGTQDGLTRMEGQEFNRLTKADGLVDDNVFCIATDAQQRLWVGTSNGITCLTDTGSRHIRLASDLGSNYINLLQLDEQGRLWIGTNNGLYRSTPEGLLSGQPAEHFTRADGLRSLEFNLNSGFVDDRGRLWAGTANGLLRYDPQRDRQGYDQAAPQVHITGLRSYLQPIDWSTQSKSTSTLTGLPEGLNIQQQRNYLTFDYTGVSLSTPRKVRYRYMMEGLDEDWLPPTDGRFASYSNIPHGDHRFLVKATDDLGVWSEPAVFSFTVAAPFYLKWWFFLLCAAAMALVAYGIHKIRKAVRARREKTRQLLLRSRMLQLEQQALNANMNRHFVFNALNSIQYYINRQDRKAANKYLTSFAKLIRKNLDSSQDDMTTLHEEIERLELYLTLEHMRFKDKFDYSITVADGVDLNAVRLPAMMLQPYVENSIWHGILPAERPGTVSLQIGTAAPGRVRIQVIDDGIGIDNSMHAKANGVGDRISKGIEITKGRADVLRRLAISDIRITGPEQFNDPSNTTRTGTCVTIELPSDHAAQLQELLN